MVEAYPLQWPPGKPRTGSFKRRRSQFQTSRAKAIAGLLSEIQRLRGRMPVISSNLTTYNRGGQRVPYASQRVDDPGVAVYFDLRGEQRCFALDIYTTIGDNIHAIELTIAALRGIERWGGAEMMEAAFRGFDALPSPDMVMAMPEKKAWHVVFGVAPDAPPGIRKAAYRTLAKKLHPDNPTTGNKERFAELQIAAGEASI